MPPTFVNDYGGSQAKLPGRMTAQYWIADVGVVGGWKKYTISNAIPYPISKRELAASYGAYQASDIVWTLGERELAAATPIAPAVATTIVPKPRDRIYDNVADVAYIVLDVAHGMLGRFYKVVTRVLSIVTELRDLVNLQHPTITQSAAGGRSVSWANYTTDIPCRVQPRTVDTFDDRGVRSTQTVYDVILGQEIAATNAGGDWGRLVFGSVNLQITGYRDSNKIDLLPVAECVKVP